MRLRGAVLVGVLVLSVPSPGATQGSQPLRKTDVIRLLSNPLISKSEVADLIRRNCVAFRPTPRDWADLRDFGADSDVLNSIGGCATSADHRAPDVARSEEHTSELQSRGHLVCRLLLEKKKNKNNTTIC